MKKEEIEQLLARKFQKESARLKSWGTKTDDKAALSFAMCVSEFVRALMADSRYRELKRMDKIRRKSSDSDDFNNKFDKYIAERMKATKQMAAAIKKFAEDKESKRAWKSKERHERQHHKSSRRIHEEDTHHKQKSKSHHSKHHKHHR